MTDSTVTEPDPTAWQEPRGPHLPDALVRVPLPVWPLLVIAAVTIWVPFDHARSQGVLDPTSVAITVIGALGAVVAPLLGVALLLRHPDAWSRWPVLTFGMVLLAAGQALELASPVIRVWLDQLAPAEPDMIQPAPLSTLVQVTVSVLAVVAFLSIARGLHGARSKGHGHIGRGPLLVGLAVALVPVVLNAVTALAGWSQFDWQMPYAVLSVITQTAVWLATTCLAIVLVVGARAGERPRAAWWTGATALCLRLGLIVALSIISVVQLAVNAREPGLSPGFFNAVIVADALSWFLLLLAFALGLPGHPASTGHPARDQADDASESPVASVPV